MPGVGNGCLTSASSAVRDEVFTGALQRPRHSGVSTNPASSIADGESSHSLEPTLIQAADQLSNAAKLKKPAEPVRELLYSSGQAAQGGQDSGVDATVGLSGAYQVQMHNIGRLIRRGGDTIVGRKVGLTAPSVQAQLGVDQPDFGTLLASMQVPHDEEVDFGRLLQPRIEAEVAFELSADLIDVPDDPEDLVDVIGRAVPALEIVDSRIAGWDITLVDTVADNASSALFVLGPHEFENWTPQSLIESTARPECNGNGVEVSTGSGADCLASPLNSLHWLARILRDLGTPLRAGDIILTGAFGPMSPVHPGDRFTATFDGTHAVSVTFSEGSS